jgi:hypothetical protein
VGLLERYEVAQAHGAWDLYQGFGVIWGDASAFLLISVRRPPAQKKPLGQKPWASIFSLEISVMEK